MIPSRCGPGRADRPGSASRRRTSRRPAIAPALVAAAIGSVVAGGCELPRGARWDGGPGTPDGGGLDIECGGDPADDGQCVHEGASEVFVSCVPEQEFYRLDRRDCRAEGLVCVGRPPFTDCESGDLVAGVPPLGCVLCRPCELGCAEGNVARCLPDGSGWEVIEYCRTEAGEACENGRCVNGCEAAVAHRSNVGCEYWAVDLDNAYDSGISAAGQQFAVVVSNPSTNVEAFVTVEICHRQPCSDEANLEVVAEAVVNRRDLEIFELEQREVDGVQGDFENEPGTALGPRAFRVSSSWPIIAYQFNPLQNYDVFSNDASLLLPTSALDTRYTILSWPQTIARVPGDSNVDRGDDFPAFVTIVGVDDDTSVTVETTANIVPSGESPPLVPHTRVGETLVATIHRFDVLNLETGYHDGSPAFLADFTGTVVESSAPVAVFAGVEATDVPIWETVAERLAAADHLEQQQWPDRTLGFSYVVAHTPRRTQALAATGAVVTPLAREPEWYRIMALRDGTIVETTLPDHPVIDLDALEYVTLRSETHFIVRANQPVNVGQFVGGQDTTGIPWTFPGGDPAFILVPPIEQWRAGYVFLTPNAYMFDFLMVAVGRDQASLVELDGQSVSTLPACSRERADGLPPDDPSVPDYYVITCALSAPEWDPELRAVVPGLQNDVPHEVYVRGGGSRGIGIIVYGFDRYVSYGYAGGTDLRLIQ